ncbi:hypothetical protein ACEWY4_017434 [Coilia grayii]|uniref:Uncharacterized protein n=1 Tax=Coilia grayii TaxID=363190 RepID=A0ABD1JGU9_9TELE
MSVPETEEDASTAAKMNPPEQSADEIHKKALISLKMTDVARRGPKKRSYIGELHPEKMNDPETETSTAAKIPPEKSADKPLTSTLPTPFKRPKSPDLSDPMAGASLEYLDLLSAERSKSLDLSDPMVYRSGYSHSPFSAKRPKSPDLSDPMAGASGYFHSMFSAESFSGSAQPLPLLYRSGYSPSLFSAKRKSMMSPKMRTSHYYTGHATYDESICRICHQYQRDPVHTPCRHVFCRQCILTHLEKQSETGVYSCPKCRRKFSTRPVLHPHQGQLYQRVKAGDPFQSVVMNHKASVKRRIEQFSKGITETGSHTSHSVYIIKDDAVQSYKTPEFTINCNVLFEGMRPFWMEKMNVRTVITQGASGYGKTNSVHKFILDWADGNANKDVDFVFTLPFWKLNLVKDLSCSLHKLLLNFHPELHTLADVKQLDDAKIVVIFDGLDESQLALDFQNNQMLCDISETSSVDTVVTNMIKGNLLPFAKVWITSDPSTASQIPSHFINRVTEIALFSDSELENCVRESLNDVTQESSILQQIKMSKGLHAMSYIPAFCSIAVSLAKNMLVQDKSSMIQTCTELYSHYFLGQITTDAEAKSSSVQCEAEDKKTSREVLLKFAELAWRHLRKNNLIFSEQDLKDCHIDVSDTESFCGLCTEITEENSEFFQETVYYFTHVTIHEFLAALCVFEACITKNMDILKDFFEDESEIHAEDISLDILLKSTVTKVLNRQCRYQHFLRFLIGMSLESSQTLLQSLLTGICSSSATTANTLKYIKVQGKWADVSLERRIDLLHCQIEMQDPCVMEDIESLLTSQRSFSSSHWMELAKLLKMSGQVVDEFRLQDNLGSSLHHPVLSIFVGCSRKVRLHNCHLSGESCRGMASVLQQPNCPLRELDMSGNPLFGYGVELLCRGLRSPNCKLEVLRLSNCGLSWESCGYMASVLQQPNCPLRELDMSGNALFDYGVELLCPGLRSPNCKLEVLRLYGCNLKAKSCFTLDSVLGSEHSCLRELDVSSNYLDDSGEKLLADRLKEPECKLETLKTKPFLYAESPPTYLGPSPVALNLTKTFLYAESLPDSLGPSPVALNLPHSSASWSELMADVPNIQPEGSDCQTYHKADLARCAYLYFFSIGLFVCVQQWRKLHIFSLQTTCLHSFARCQ